MIKTRIAGIPCTVRVDYFHPGCSARITDDPGTSHPLEDDDIEYTVCDQSGRPAQWLAAKVTSAIDLQIVMQIIDAHYG